MNWLLRQTSISILTVSIILIFGCGEKNKAVETTKGTERKLPYLGDKEVVYSELNGEEIADTIYHTIPSFSFVNQSGRRVTQENYKGKIYIADFIFTTCPSICPVMTGHMKNVQEYFKNTPDVKILSHSIDPEYDTPEVLLKYALDKGADTSMWTFVTGDRDSIYTICEKGYMAFAKEDKKAEGGYIHSGFFVLIDRKGHIRGAYDGTDEGKVEDMIADIELLLNEK